MKNENKENLYMDKSYEYREESDEDDFSILTKIEKKKRKKTFILI